MALIKEIYFLKYQLLDLLLNRKMRGWSELVNKWIGENFFYESLVLCFAISRILRFHTVKNRLQQIPSSKPLLIILDSNILFVRKHFNETTLLVKYWLYIANIYSFTENQNVHWKCL